MPPNDQLESSAVLVLISLFIGIIGQGLFLAVSVGAILTACNFLLPWSLSECVRHLLRCLQGFLPESLDQFAQNVVYKTFSPTVGIFLASSAAYGVWKVGFAILCSLLNLLYLGTHQCRFILSLWCLQSKQGNAK